MKYPLTWYEDNLKNATDYVRRRREEANRILAEVDKIERENAEEARRIELARSRGLTEFDPDRFGKKRNETD